LPQSPGTTQSNPKGESSTRIITKLDTLEAGLISVKEKTRKKDFGQGKQ